jgi:release factor glutamine methyltransferase
VETTATPETLDFDGLEISFDDRLLRPRPWTAAQSRWAAELLPTLPAGPVLELCSGAGQIGLRAVVTSERRLVCVDIDPVAASYTVRNARAAGLGDRVQTRTGPMEHVLEEAEQFPLVIADPPWVPRADTGRFPEDPLRAIDGGDDGMAVISLCVTAITEHLAPYGVALLQLGTAAQATAVGRLLEGSRVRAGELREYGERGVLLRLDHHPDHD